jgi:hypothetical protein
MFQSPQGKTYAPHSTRPNINKYECNRTAYLSEHDPFLAAICLHAWTQQGTCNKRKISWKSMWLLVTELNASWQLTVNGNCTMKVMQCHHLNLLSHTIHDWSAGILDVILKVPSLQNRPCGTNIPIHTLHRCIPQETKRMYCKHSCQSTVTFQFGTKKILSGLFFPHTVCWPNIIFLLESVSCHTHVCMCIYVYGCMFCILLIL